MTPSIRLLGWSAWSPSLPDRNSWYRWLGKGTVQQATEGLPANKDVSPMLRRRATMNARMTMETAFEACRIAAVDPKACHLLLGTANGETSALTKLLEDLCRNEPLSPIAFTNSVHNVPTGYFSIAAKHLAVSRTISAFGDTFVCSFLDTLCLLASQPEMPALLILSDEVPPSPFDEMLEVPPFPYSVALVLRVCKDDEQGALSLIKAKDPIEEPATAWSTEPLFNFLKWYDSGASSMHMRTAFGAVLWQKS